MWFCKSYLLIWLLGAHAMLQINADVNLSNHKLSGVIQWKYEKRPICNALTGCGSSKRSSYPPYPMVKRMELEEKNFNNDDLAEADLSDVIDINAEPAIENVQNQIMSQAKIFEAIKEASKEIYRQKNKQRIKNQQRTERMQQEKLNESENV